MTAYLLMAVLTLAAALLLTRPWWSRAMPRALQRRAANVAAYRTRLAELDEEMASGLLDASAAQALKDELGTRLLSEAQVQDADVSAAPPAYAWALGVLLLIAVFAGGWYALAGSWRTQALVDLAQRDPAAAQMQAVQAMVEGLATKLRDKPDDVEGWGMLGRSYFMLQRYAEAASAYARANQLSGEQNADWLQGEGEALALSGEVHDLRGKPRERFEAALKLEPDHGRALWYAGLAAAQAGDYKTAAARWQALSRQDLPPDLRAALTQRITELAQLSGEPQPQVQTPQTLALDVDVSLAPALTSRLEGRSTLFVFAKADNGPPMPLAVQRLTGAKLPLRVTLDDSMAMTPQLKLSQFERWVVTARLTAGNTVQAESGDLQGRIVVDKTVAQAPLRLVIDEVVP